jgi:hypothetical protein
MSDLREGGRKGGREGTYRAGVEVGELVLEHEARHAQDGVLVVGPVREDDVEDAFACKKERKEGRREGGRGGG